MGNSWENLFRGFRTVIIRKKYDKFVVNLDNFICKDADSWESSYCFGYGDTVEQALQNLYENIKGKEVSGIGENSYMGTFVMK